MQLLISYSSKDIKTVKIITEKLHSLNFNLWIDTHEMTGIDDDFGYRISNAMLASDAVLMMISPNSISSHWVEWELNFSLEMEKYQPSMLFPVLISGNELPVQLSDREYFDFRTWDLFRNNFIKLFYDLLRLKPSYQSQVKSITSVSFKEFEKRYFLEGFENLISEREKLFHLRPIRSPMIGTFYRSPKPEDPNFVDVGDKIEIGQTVCIIEAMKLFNQIECDFGGLIEQVLVEKEQHVEYDQPLFIIKSEI